MYVFAYLIIYTAVFVAGVVFPLPSVVFSAVGLVSSLFLVLSSLFLVVSSGMVVSVRIYAADLPGGHTQRLLRAAAALASKTKLQGKFAGCDCSNYQLFMYSSRVGVCRAICRLKY